MNEQIWLHGEVLIKKVGGEIPSDAKRIYPNDGSYRVADSEVTGNHHLLEDIEGLEVFEKDGLFYVRPTKEITVRCVIKERHDSFTIPPCKEGEILIFDRQQEVDHLTDEVMAVRD